jgi:hypothetical protein
MDEGEAVRRSSVRRKRKLNLPVAKSPSNLPVVVKKGSGLPPMSDALSEIDKRIATASMSELPSLIQVRGAIIEQDEYRLEGAHQRRGQMGVFYSKVGFSVAAAIGGTALVVAGFGLPGFFLLGGAAAVYVPEYVKNFVDRFGRQAGDAE